MAPARGSVELAPQPGDVHLDDVRVTLEVVVPDAREDVRLGHDLSGPSHQVGEEVELPRGERYLGIRAPHAPGADVQPQVAHHERGWLAERGPAEESVDPGDQDREGERLAEIVVRAGVEPLGLVEVPVLRGEHEDRRRVPAMAEVGAHPVAVAARQHDVEQDQVVGALLGPPEPFESVPDDLDRETLRGQTTPQRARDLGVVLDEQQLHRRPLLSGPAP
jgi:hypothetical protein